MDAARPEAKDEPKLQIPSTKHQRNFKLQVPIWILVLLWSLVLGAWSFILLRLIRHRCHISLFLFRRHNVQNAARCNGVRDYLSALLHIDGTEEVLVRTGRALRIDHDVEDN